MFVLHFFCFSILWFKKCLFLNNSYWKKKQTISKIFIRNCAVELILMSQQFKQTTHVWIIAKCIGNCLFEIICLIFLWNHKLSTKVKSTDTQFHRSHANSNYTWLLFSENCLITLETFKMIDNGKIYLDLKARSKLEFG